ncbi:DUF3127 domain-containing protein [Aurantibacter sp.]|uniref:DUF3127 domain-containing protein n=1 Tax=Aurantibacter sp. TaxID=2807103 RepID=UPI0032656E6E
MDISGKIKLINKTQNIGNNGFKKRELVVVTNEQYPQMLLVEFVQDKCDLLNSYTIGDEVTVFINLRGREWINPEGQSKYFNSIQGWKIIMKNDVNIPPPEPSSAPIDEDLPF